MRINFGLAMLSLLVSVTLWVLVLNDQNPDRTDTPDIAISVEPNKVPPGLVLMNNAEPVRVKLRAPKDRWSDLRASSFRASVDLSRLGPGIQSVPITVEPSDPQVRVLEVIPSTFSARLEEIQERTVPVKVNVAGNVPFGYVYSAPLVDPQSVVVSGPTSLVQSVDTASVEVRLDGITVEVDSSFHPLAVDSNGGPVRSIQVNPQAVKVRVPVEQQVSYKQVGVRASITGTVAPGYWIESVITEPASVTVVGDPKALAKINYLDTSPLNVAGYSSGVVQEMRIITPEGVSLLQQQTTRVKVQVSQLQTSQLLRVAPRIVNVDPQLRVMGAPSYFDVTIQGPAPIMQGLRVDALAVTLDAAGLGEGSHNVNPTVSTPPAVSVVSVDPPSISLMLVAVQTPTPTPAPTATATPVPVQPTPLVGTPTPSRAN